MANTKEKLAFNGTKEQKELLDQVIANQLGDPGALMPVLQKAQDIYGYLPKEVQIMIAEGLNIPLEKVYGVATFYSQFSLTPKGKYRVSVCMGTACYVKGAGDVLEKFERDLGVKTGSCSDDGLFSVDACRCIGACGLAPVLTINEDVYGKVTVDDVATILAKYKD